MREACLLNHKLPGYSLNILGVHFRFMSDMHEFLGKCLRLHYGNMCLEMNEGAKNHSDEWCVSIMCGSKSRHEADENVLEVISGSVSIYIYSDINNKWIDVVSAGEQQCEGSEIAGYFFVSICTAVQIALKEIGIVVFHGASAVRDGQAVLIAGQNGCGKSTLLKKLMSEGWDYLADDSSTVVIEGDVFKIIRNPELVNVAGIDDATIKRLKAAGFEDAHDATFLAPPSGVVSGNISTIIFPSVDESGRGEFVKLTVRELMLRLMDVRKTPFRENECARFLDMCLSISGTANGYIYEMKRGEIPAAYEFAEHISKI